jgi:TolB protein
MNRREFLALVALTSAVSAASCRQLSPAPGSGTSRVGRFFFVSQGMTAVMNTDGTGLRHFDFRMPNQVTWQPGPFLSDGRRVIFLSMETRRDGPGRPFEEYYTQTPTHLWLYDLERETLTELATKERLAVFYTPALLLTDERILVQVVRNNVGQIFSMNLDGSDAREFTRAGEGLPYGLSLSPDKRRVAFHLATPQGYQIWTSDADGKDRVRVAAHPDHLYFGTSWAPDGQWILYQDCHFRTDPGHDWSDICIGRPDGSEHRALTKGQAQWFGAAYGPRESPAGGSNMPSWTHDGGILFSRKIAGSKVPWEFQPNRPDTDHFNRDFKPELARGGTEIYRLDPRDGTATRLTHREPPVWDFRPGESPDGTQIMFCRAETGSVAGIWVMDSAGHARLLTPGLDGKGADHPRWLPTATPRT